MKTAKYVSLVWILLAVTTATAAGGGYVAGAIGNGSAYGSGTEGDKSMKWRTFEVRFGAEIDPTFLPENAYTDHGRFRVDFVHYNEGHPDNNHRDGFGAQVVYRQDIGSRISVEAGVGPYVNMNTTTKKNDVEYDDTNLGTLVSLALLAHADEIYPGMQLRFAVNHVTVPGAPSTNAFLVGIARDFDLVSGSGQSGRGDSAPVWFSVAGGTAKTNHGGTNVAHGYSVEAKVYDGRFASSVAAIEEGDDQVRVDRRGVAFQGWFIQPLTDKWSMSAGVGPYVAVNERNSGKAEIDGLITIQVDRAIGKKWKVFASFSRVASFSRNNDRDIARIGVSRKLGN